MRSQRQLRVGEEIRHALAALLMRGDVPWPPQFTPPITITVTEVTVSPDLKNATTYVMPLGGERIKETVRAMNEIAGYFRHEIGKTVTLRHVPAFRFFADESFIEAQRIQKLLLDPQVAKDLGKSDR